MLKIKSKFKNNYVRALCYQLFEHNGVIKRETVDQIVKNISKEEYKNIIGTYKRASNIIEQELKNKKENYQEQL